MSEITMKVTPEMVRLLMKSTRKDSRYATTSNAESFIKLFKDEIEIALRDELDYIDLIAACEEEYGDAPWSAEQIKKINLKKRIRNIIQRHYD